MSDTLRRWTRAPVRAGLMRGALAIAVLSAVGGLPGCASTGAAGAGAAAAGAASTTATAVPAASTATVTTVYLVRHAEKAAQPANDPPLTPAGEVRARALAAALRDAGVQAIITTQFLRTRETARPLAELLPVVLEVVAAGGPSRDHAKAVAAAVRAHAGQTVLVVGHSNTVNQIIEQLGGPKLPDLCDNAYANLFVVHLTAGGPTHLARTDYGARLAQPSAECPGMSP